MKGADVVMSGIVQYNDWLEEEVCFYVSHESCHIPDDTDFIPVNSKSQTFRSHADVVCVF